MTRPFNLSILRFAIAIFLGIGSMGLVSCSKEPLEVRTVNVNALVAEGKLDDAANEVTRALAEYPNNVDLLYNLASIQRLQGKLDIAQRTLSKALSLSPNDDDANYLMVEILTASGSIQDAWDRFHMLSESYRRKARTQHMLGIIYSLLGNWKNAEGCFRAAIDLGDKSAAAKSALAFVTCKQDRLEEGKAYLSEAETAPDSTPESMSQIAECCLLLEKAQKARDIAQKLTEQYPSNASYWSLLGRAEMKLLSFGDAENSFTRALTASSSNPWIQVQYAEMLFASHREDEALAQATDAESKISKMNIPIHNPSLYNLLATLYARNGQTLLAQRFLNRSLQIDPSQTKTQIILQKISSFQQPEFSSDSIDDSTPATP